MPRDQLILEHIAKFEISTKTILHRLFYEGRRMKAVDSTIRRLDGRGVGYLHGSKLPRSRTLRFRLTPSGGRHLGIQVDTQPIPIIRLFKLVGRLHFINKPPTGIQRTLCGDSILKKLITCEALEVGKIRPPRVDFYIAQNKMEGAENTDLALGAMLPDLNSDIRRVVDRIVTHSKGFVERNWFADVMRAGRFEWTILTGHKAKADELQLAATRVLRRRMVRLYFKHSLDSTDVPPIRIKVEVIPELANLRLLKRRKKKNS